VKLHLWNAAPMMFVQLPIEFGIVPVKGLPLNATANGSQFPIDSGNVPVNSLFLREENVQWNEVLDQTLISKDMTLIFRFGNKTQAYPICKISRFVHCPIVSGSVPVKP